MGWSGRWESNPRHSAWEADVLPLNYARSSAPHIDSSTRVAQEGRCLRRPERSGPGVAIAAGAANSRQGGNRRVRRRPGDGAATTVRASVATGRVGEVGVAVGEVGVAVGAATAPDPSPPPLLALPRPLPTGTLAAAVAATLPWPSPAPTSPAHRRRRATWPWEVLFQRCGATISSISARWAANEISAQ